MSYFNKVTIGQITNYLKNIFSAIAEPVWMSQTGSIRQVDVVASVTAIANTVSIVPSTTAAGAAISTASLASYEPMYAAPLDMAWQLGVRSHIL